MVLMREHCRRSENDVETRVASWSCSPPNEGGNSVAVNSVV